jgi:LuxR family transcriptional regulator, maltose regulon positive regulatory protein
MSIPVTRTKVILPRRRADLLSRKRLVDLMYELLDYRLIILTAPAGYGKTSLLIDFAHKTDLAVCWYSIDVLDLDPLRFLAHFIAALSQRFPEFGSQSVAMMQSMNQVNIDDERLVSTIVNDAYEHIREHFLLVLDDYHLVNDSKEIDHFINRFIQDVDENCHLLLSSRTLLTLPDMPLMVARSQVAGLSFEELAFLPDEIQMLVFQNNQITISEEIAKELVRETEGWVTGLLLSTQTMWQGMVDRLRVARVSGVGLYDYLAQQVLEQQPIRVRDFLLFTSYLEEFDAELCKAVFGTDQDWSLLIDIILQNNLFVLPVGEDGRAIRYHHLFRDFLQTRLEHVYPERRDPILRKIGEVYASREEWEKAFALYQHLGDSEATAQLIIRAGTNLISSGRVLILNEWISSIPDFVLVGLPALLSIKGVVLASLGSVEAGLVYLNQAAVELRDSNDLPNLTLTLVRRATAHRFRGKYQDSFNDALEAYQLAGQDEKLQIQKAEALRTLGINLYYMGHLPDAIDRYRQSLEIYELLNDQQNRAMLLMELGLAYMNTGRYTMALNYYQQSLEYWRESGNMLRTATLYNNLGVLYYLMGDYSKAAGFYEEGLTRSRQAKHPRTEAYILSGIGDLYADLHATSAAIDAYQKARDVAQKIDYRFLLIYVDLAEAAQARREGDLGKAQSFLTSASRLIDDGRSDFEKALVDLEAGQLARREMQVEIAVQKIECAAKTLEAEDHKVEAARAYLVLAATLYEAKQIEPAIEHLGRALKLAEVLDSLHVLVVAGQETKALLEAASLNPYHLTQASNLLAQVLDFEKNIPVLRRRMRPQVAAVPFAPPKLTIQTLGRSQVELDGKPVTAPEWQNQKRVRELFFYLLQNPQGLTKEQIGYTFWPDSSPGQLKLQFKNTIYRLRLALGQDVISFNDDIYWFNRQIDYEYDLEVFVRKIDQARTTQVREAKMSMLREAIAVYKGSYLNEFDFTWVTIEREHLWQLYVDAALELAQLHLEAGNYGATLEFCHNLLAVDKCLEEAHRLAMRAYAAKGNRAAVRRQFESCKQALMQEIQSTPSTQTFSLYEALKG